MLWSRRFFSVFSILLLLLSFQVNGQGLPECIGLQQEPIAELLKYSVLDGCAIDTRELEWQRSFGDGYNHASFQFQDEKIVFIAYAAPDNNVAQEVKRVLKGCDYYPVTFMNAKGQLGSSYELGQFFRKAKYKLVITKEATRANKNVCWERRFLLKHKSEHANY